MYSSVGTFTFCHLNKPDTKFKAEGEYSVAVAFDKSDAGTKKMLAELDKAWAKAEEEANAAFAELPKAALAKLKAKKITEATTMPYFTEEFDENDQPTGRIILRFKTKAVFTDRKTGETVKKVVPLFDGKGQPIPAKKRPLVYAGTTGRINFNAASTFIPATGEGYLSLYLSGVQIKDLVSSGGGGGGFGALDDSSFSADDLDEYTPDEEADDDGDDPSGDAEGGDDIDDEIPF